MTSSRSGDAGHSSSRRAFVRGVSAFGASVALGTSAAVGTLGQVGCAGPSTGVSLWYSYGGKNREALLALVARFNAEHPEHALTPVYQGDYFELLAKLRTALHAGAGPAVTHVIAEVLPYLAEAGVLESLDEQPELAGDLDLVEPLSQNGAFSPKPGRLISSRWGLPFNRSTPIAYFNGSVLGELGLAPPTSWDELRAFARAATRGEGSERRWGLGCPIDWWFWVALVGQAGGSLTNEEGRFVLGGEAGVEALSLWSELVHDLGVMRPPPGRDYNAWQVNNGDFLAGRAAMIWTSTAFVRYLEDNARFPVRTAPLPRRVRHAVPTGGTMFVLPRGATEPARRAGSAFLRFMASPGPSNEFATKTGYIPVSRGGVRELERSGFYRAHPNDRVALDQLEHVLPWPWDRDLFRIQREIVQPRLEAAILERKSPREALADAVRAIEEDT